MYQIRDTTQVAPFAGAWIEIYVMPTNLFADLSLPSRERGLKFDFPCKIYLITLVAPFAGAWIEITLRGGVSENYCVAPFAGAWIEICYSCGYCVWPQVAPFAGAWIVVLEYK